MKDPPAAPVPNVKKAVLELLNKMRHRSTPVAPPSALEELRRFISWSLPNPKLAVIICDPSLVSPDVLAMAGLYGVLFTDLAVLEKPPCTNADGGPAVLAYGGKVSDVLAAAAASSTIIDLIVMEGYDGFAELLDQAYLPFEKSTVRLPPPDIAVFTDDCGIFNRAWWRNRIAYEALIEDSIACVAEKIIYFSYNQPLTPAGFALSNGGMVVAKTGDALRFLLKGFFTANSRTESTIRIIRSLLSGDQAGDDLRRDAFPTEVFVVVQHGDYNLTGVRSVAYGKKRGEAPAVRLIPDAFFFEAEGYRIIRRAVAEGELPEWAYREDIVFWRGSTTHNGVSPYGEPILNMDHIPRVAMCLALRGHAGTDVGLTGPWGRLPEEWGQPHEDWERLVRADVHRPAIPMIEHARFRYLIDIDGVANAWSFFEKLLLGSCILKVSSRFEQWFYDEISAWEHFVPVRADLSDLVDKIEWCREHEGEARAIAEAGQKFATGHTYELGRRLAVHALRECAIPFGHWPP